MSSRSIGKIIGIVFGVALGVMFIYGAIRFFFPDKLTSEIIFGTLGALAGIGALVGLIRKYGGRFNILSKIKAPAMGVAGSAGLSIAMLMGEQYAGGNPTTVREPA